VTTAGPLAGTGRMVRLVLRRDRVRLPVWVLGTTGVTAASAQAVLDLYDTPAEIAGYAATVTGSAATQLTNGEPYGVDAVGGIVAYEVSSTAWVAVALMVTFLVVRHTRTEEETGRAELLRAGVLGRWAATAAAYAVAVAAALLVGALDTAVLLAADLPTQGAVLHGAALVGVGVAATGLAAVAAQVVTTGRWALGLAGGVVGALFTLRGLGDVFDVPLGWASPFGWAQEVRPFGTGDEGPRAWPLLLLAGLAVVGAAAAAVLLARRDVGAGLLRPRPAAPRASRWLTSAPGLALRQQRGLLLGWLGGLVPTALLFGAVGEEVVAMVEDNPDLAAVLQATGAASVVDSFFGFTLAFVAVIATAYGVSSALRLRAEEESGRLEALLATGLSRTRWAVGSLLVTLVGTVVLLGTIGLATGVAHALTSGDGGAVLRLTGGGLAQAPAALVVVGAAVLLQGWLPRWSRAAWAVLGLALLENYLGALLDLPSAVVGLSPFHWLAAPPAEPVAWGPVGAELVLAAALLVAGVVGLRRRDLG